MGPQGSLHSNVLFFFIVLLVFRVGFVCWRVRYGRRTKTRHRCCHALHRLYLLLLSRLSFGPPCSWLRQVVWGSRLRGGGNDGLLAAAVDPQTGDVFAAGYAGQPGGNTVCLRLSCHMMGGNSHACGSRCAAATVRRRVFSPSIFLCVSDDYERRRRRQPSAGRDGGWQAWW